LPDGGRVPAADRPQLGRGACRLPAEAPACRAGRRGRRPRAGGARGRGGRGAGAGSLLPVAVLRAAFLIGALLAVGCGPSLPDPQAPGALGLKERCTGCPGLSAPGSMTLEMWKMQLARMQGEFARHGLPWLTTSEERALMEYLAAHAGTS